MDKNPKIYSKSESQGHLSIYANSTSTKPKSKLSNATMQPQSCLNTVSVFDSKTNNKKSVKSFHRSHTKMVNKDLIQAKMELENLDELSDENTKNNDDKKQSEVN